MRWSTLRCWTVLAVCPVVATGAGCRGDDPETIVEEATERDRPEIVLGEPFEGTATVDHIESDRAFRLFDTLVVSAEPVEVHEGAWTVVRGTVRRWDVETLEKELGVDFDNSLDDLDDELVIVAEHVEAAPEGDPGRTSGITP